MDISGKEDPYMKLMSLRVSAKLILFHCSMSPALWRHLWQLSLVAEWEDIKNVTANIASSSNQSNELLNNNGLKGFGVWYSKALFLSQENPKHSLCKVPLLCFIINDDKAKNWTLHQYIFNTALIWTIKKGVNLTWVHSRGGVWGNTEHKPAARSQTTHSAPAHTAALRHLL